MSLVLLMGLVTSAFGCPRPCKVCHSGGAIHYERRAIHLLPSAHRRLILFAHETHMFAGLGPDTHAFWHHPTSPHMQGSPVAPRVRHPHVKARHIALALVCMTLVLTMFGAMALAAESGNVTWLIAVLAFAAAAIIWFAISAPERWRE